MKQSVLEYAKVLEHQCDCVEELLLKVFNECEVRGYSTAKIVEIAKDVRTWYEENSKRRIELQKKLGTYKN